MKRTVALLLCTGALALSPALAEERAAVPEQYKWNTADLYPSDDAWNAAREKVAARVPDLKKLQGTLAASPAALEKALAAITDVAKDMRRVQVYASMRSDEDTRDAKHREMNQAARHLGVDFAAATAWVRPEILAIGAGKVRRFEAENPRLAPWAMYLDDIVRWETHTLPAEEETLVAEAGNLTGAGGAIRNVFADAEFPWPTITLADGTKVRLDAQAYTKYRASTDRDERIAVFKAFFGALAKFGGTFGATLDATVKAHVFEKKVHKFDSCLAAATFPDNVPVAVYHELIADVHRNLPTLQRYLKLRRRMMGLDTLRYEDLYAPIVKSVDLRYTPEQAKEMVLKAVAPLGPDYVATLRKGYADRWVDWMPTPGKRSGAYSTGVWGVHPYQLQNFTGLYEEVSTLAHESGHSMHTYLANTHQPFTMAHYPIFVAEVASTLNESLLLRSMLEKTKDRDTRLFLLGTRLDNLRTTLFRQTLFAEFELKMHEMGERGEPLTGDKLTALYLGLLKQYYGDAEGVCKIDDLYGIEWAYIPHFFYDFYVYQYATSEVASSYLVKTILDEAASREGRTRARDAYLKMLSAGGSEYAVNLLKDAGVDMTTPAPFDAAMADMNGVMDQMEALLREKP